jgi:hypothetical protein
LYLRCQLSCDFNNGNDTIDPYPLIPREAEKILCITQATFLNIHRAYQVFQEFIKPVTLIKPALKIIAPTTHQTIAYQHTHDYQPSNAIYVNECDYRRWCRVSEWFNTYGQGIYE